MNHDRACRLVLVAIFFSFLGLRADFAFAQGQPLPAVVVAPAEMSDLRPRLVFSGRLVGSQRVDIRARVTGFLEEVLFEEGATVEEGMILYRVEDDTYSATVDEISGSISAAEAEVRLAEIERDRKQTLVERDTVAQSELDIAIAKSRQSRWRTETPAWDVRSREFGLGIYRDQGPLHGPDRSHHS